MDNDNTNSETDFVDVLKDNEHIFELKDKLAAVLHGNSSHDCFLAVRMMLVQLLCDTCTSKDAAIEMVAEAVGSSILIINRWTKLVYALGILAIKHCNETGKNYI